MTQLIWPWHAMIKAHKVILSAHSLWINNFEKCLYQSKKEILEPSGQVWYPTRKKYFEGTTLRRKGVQVHLWWVRSRRRRLRFAKEWEREGGGGGEHVGVNGDRQETMTSKLKRLCWSITPTWRRSRRRAWRSWWGQTCYGIKRRRILKYEFHFWFPSSIDL